MKLLAAFEKRLSDFTTSLKIKVLALIRWQPIKFGSELFFAAYWDRIVFRVVETLPINA